MAGTVCAVVRMYNEARVLAPTLAGLADVVDEIICIDDGSSDTSAAIAAASGATVLRHAVNLGGGAALRTGLDYARRESDHAHVLCFDADGQHRPEDAARMIHVARRDALDVVLGTRDRTEVSMPRSRRLLLTLALHVSRQTSGLALTDTHNGLRVFSRHALGHIRLTQAGMAYASELEASISRAGLSWAEVPVSIVYDDYSLAKGQSNVNALNIACDLMLARMRRTA